MAITDFATLKATVQNWCARSDSKFSSQMETFVALGEDRLYNGAGEKGDPLYSEPLRSKVMETDATVAMVSGTGTIPDDVLEIRSIGIADNRLGLVYQTPERIEVTKANIPGGDPLYYTIEGVTLTLVPEYTGNVTLGIHKRHPPVTETSTSDPLLLEHPLLYLEATLFEAFTWMQDVDMATGHIGKLRSLVAGANRSTKGLRYPGKLRVQPRVWIP